jgi:molecular chaperone GrpE (heat shock protein)
MTELQQQYATHPYGKSYNSLADTLRLAFTEMGVTEYSIATGDIVDKSRMLVVDTEYSNDYSADTVLRPLGSGLELQGYIVRYATCVASLGPESAKAAAAEQEAVAEQEDKTTPTEA